MIPFGTTKSGETVNAITLSAHGLTATLLTYGAIVQDVRLDGFDHSLTVGSDTLTDYETTMPYHGSIVGPVANRISDAHATINGTQHTFDTNFNDTHTLHGGTRGTFSKVWDIDEYTKNTATLSLLLPNGDGGFPANRHMTARFEIIKGPALRLTITTTSDGPSIANLTNHSYWCLDGSGTMTGHTLHILADTYLPTDDQSLVTGDIARVAFTPLDFRKSRPLNLGAHPIDNTFCVGKARRALTDVAHLSTPDLTMTVATTEPGLHIYDDRPGFGAIAIEAQGWPNAPNNPHFPDISVSPDSPVEQVTQWRFTRL